MHDTSKLKNFLRNNYYSPSLLESGEFYQAICGPDNKLKELAQPVLEWLQNHYDAKRMQGWNESQLEEKFLRPLYRQLGFAFAVEIPLTFQGKQHKIDAAIFASKTELQDYEAQYQAQAAELKNEAIYQNPPHLIAEHKQYSVPIDNNKVKDNPHHQLMNYLASCRVDKGFLTNGRYWRFYNVRKLTAEKIYYQIDLEVLLELATKASSCAIVAWHCSRLLALTVI